MNFARKTALPDETSHVGEPTRRRVSREEIAEHLASELATMRPLAA